MAIKALPKEPFHLDVILLLICITLVSIGYVMVISSSLHLGEKAGNVYSYPLKQLIHIVLGTALGYWVATKPLQVWEKYSKWLFLFGLLLLVLVLIPHLGVRVNGSMRWLSIGGVRIQVSEIVKIFSVVYIASYVTRHQESVRVSAYGIVKPLAVFSVACIFLLLEPDFGSSVVILMIAMGVMFLGGARLSQFIILLSLVVVLAIILVIVEPYRMQRVTSFLHPWDHARKEGFQLVQALISFGRGEWMGVGLGNGIQKLFYLPEAHTDFLFSVIAEELGLLGVVLVIGLFASLVWRTFMIAQAADQAGEKFSAFVAYGLGIWFGFQAFVNMGVNMGILPTKGLTLPFMSYGGGSMISMCCAVSLLFRIYSETYEINANKPKERNKWLNG